MLYQRLFDYSGSIESILDLPYCLFNDVVKKQHEYKLKENEEMKKSLDKKNSNRNQGGPFKRN